MTDTNTLGSYLRRERERRGLSLRTISEKTKVSAGLLEGLEADDISRWPGGIFRRAFVRSYAQCVGLDPEEWSGFAFGCGIERVAQLRHDFPDIRALWDGDLRVLRQF